MVKTFDRLIPALLLFVLGLLIRPAFSQTTLQNVGICYATNGANIETTYVNVPSSGAYPIASEGSVEPIEGGFIARHMVRFEFRVTKVYVPVVRK